MEILKETLAYVEYTDGQYHFRNHKFLCVAGPFDGLLKTKQQLIESTLYSGYVRYNNAETSPKTANRKSIWVWTANLIEKMVH